MTRPSDLTAVSAAHVADTVFADDLVVLGDRYCLGTRLGEGGMGVVYRAYDRMLHRTVAVKLFRDGATDMARTAAETQFLAGLNHSSLVTLFDAHIGDDRPQYLVMEYVEGPTLGERLADGPLSPRTVRTIALDIGDALHAVHAAGIVHRDVKPSNVLLRPSTVPGEDFRAKLADFGIAHLVDTARVTTPGMVIGSPAYLSPEQVTGAPPAYAADIYALGLLLLESLTGERAFPQSTAHEAAIVRLTQDPVIPASVGSAWAALLTEMTARDPGRRPTALEVVSAVSEMDPDTSGESAIVTAYAAARPLARTGDDLVSRTLVLTSRDHDAGIPDAPPLVAPPLPEPEGSSANSATPDLTDDDYVPRRDRRPRWILAAGVAVVLFVASITMTVGMLVHGAEGQAVVPPASTPAATHAATTQTTAHTAAPTPAARTQPTPAPKPHAVATETGSGKGSGNVKKANPNSGKGNNSGKG